MRIWPPLGGGRVPVGGNPPSERPTHRQGQRYRQGRLYNFPLQKQEINKIFKKYQITTGIFTLLSGYERSTF